LKWNIPIRSQARSIAYLQFGWSARICPKSDRSDDRCQRRQTPRLPAAADGAFPVGTSNGKNGISHRIYCMGSRNLYSVR
jgi:hypothetical protein